MNRLMPRKNLASYGPTPAKQQQTEKTKSPQRNMNQVTEVMDQSALLVLLFGLMVVLTTSCTSTGGGVKAGLIAPVINVSQASANENGGYQPPRSPGFNQLTGS